MRDLRAQKRERGTEVSHTKTPRHKGDLGVAQRPVDLIPSTEVEAGAVQVD